MRCIILAAGEGVRMHPLTLKTPKPMLKIQGKPLLEHIISTLPLAVDELILVVGYLQEQIRDYFKENFNRFRVNYVVQKEKLGTYHALKLCGNLLKPDERFFLLYADDLHGPKALEKCAQSEGPCLVFDENENPSKFGVVELADDGGISPVIEIPKAAKPQKIYRNFHYRVKSIEEKPEHPKTNLVLTGAQVLTKEVLNFPARRHSNGEYYLTDSIAQMIPGGHKIYAVKTDFWLPIGYPEDIKKAERVLQNQNSD